MTTNKPKVSVLCITYNQKDFIRQTLEGFMMQKTDFDFEVLINDDASTDGTQKIIAEFQEKYPDIIKPIYQPENQYSKGFRGMFTKILFPIAKGDYLALCEGDDYWTDPEKLQTQVDFMEKNSDYSVCFHKVSIVYDNHRQPDQVYPDVEDESWYTTEQLLRANYIQTNSVMYRKQDYKDIVVNVMPGDWYIHLYHAQFGKIKLIKKVMSVYRKHEGGIWWNYDVNRDEIWKQHWADHLRLMQELLKIYGAHKNYKQIIEAQIDTLIDNLIEIDEKQGTDLLNQVLEQFPGIIRTYVVDRHKLLQEKDKRIATLTSELLEVGDERAELVKKIGEMGTEIQRQAEQIRTIHSSRVWRAKRKVEGLHNKIRKQR